jgi:hypothetical protein
MENSQNWQFFRSVIDGDELRIQGLNIWDHPWNDLQRSVTVKDPIYEQDHVMGIYELNHGDQQVLFAAGEFSNMVWGIYLPV